MAALKATMTGISANELCVTLTSDLRGCLLGHLSVKSVKSSAAVMLSREARLGRDCVSRHLSLTAQPFFSQAILGPMGEQQ